MDTNHITDILPEYIDGTLTSTENKRVKTHLKDCKACKQELEEYQALFNTMKMEKEDVPSHNLEAGFLKMLEKEKQHAVKVVAIKSKRESSKNNWLSSAMKIAASLAILLTAFSAGRYFQSKEALKEIAVIESESIQLKQTTMISLMENQSASKRIQGVQFIGEFKQPDEKIIAALTDRMLNDKNTNVRLTAVEALSKLTSSEKVKETFILALGIEKDPSIQITIIQHLVTLQEKKAIQPMKKLLEQEDTQPFIKAEINQVLSQII